MLKQLALVIVEFCSSVMAAEKLRLNLSSIVTDDQAEWSLGCYGNKESIAPNILRMHRDRLCGVPVRMSGDQTTDSIDPSSPVRLSRLMVVRVPF